MATVPFASLSWNSSSSAPFSQSENGDGAVRFAHLELFEFRTNFAVAKLATTAVTKAKMVIRSIDTRGLLRGRDALGAAPLLIR